MKKSSWFSGLVLIGWLVLLTALIAPFPLTAVGSQDGGVVIVAKPTEPQSLDPQRDSGGPSSEVQESILETLVLFDHDMNLQPGLAESWEVSKDGLVYTFHLRQGVKFHDGTDFNAAAVKFVFDRSLGLIGGKKNRYIKLLGPLKAVEVVDDYTVKMILDKTFAPFINSLVHTGFAMLSPKAVETMGDRFGRAPVGTGPFKLVEWTKGQRIVMEKNPDYWQAGVPKLDRVVFRILPDSQTRVAALRAGEVNFVLQIPENLYKSLDAAPNIQTIKNRTLRTVFFRFNPMKPPFDDINVRKAFVHYVDAATICQTILEGLHFPATQPTQPPGVWGIAKDIAGYDYAPEKAAQYLEASGWKKAKNGKWMKDGQPLRFSLWTTTHRYPQDSTIAVAVKNLLNQQGLDVEVQTREWGAYRDSIFNKEFGVFLFGAGASTGDVDYVYSILFHESSRYAQGPSKAEQLLDRARTAVDIQERLQLSKEFQTVIRDQYLWFPVYWMSQLLAVSDSVKGFVPREDEKLDFTGIWIQK